MGMENQSSYPGAPLDNTTSSDWFDLNPLEAEDTRGNFYRFPYHKSWVDYPCIGYYGGTYPAGQCYAWTPYVSELKVGKP
jgi:hypothetical protein